MDESVYVQTARDLGRIKDDDGKLHFYVGSGVGPVDLTLVEYVVWKEAGSMSSINSWREEMATKISAKTRVSIQEIEKYLLGKKLLHDLVFEDENDLALLEIFVIRNGFAFGEWDGQWIVAPQDNKEKFKLSKEDYEVWVAASNSKSLLEIMAEIGEKRQYTIRQAIDEIAEKARVFIRMGLWTAEYLPEEEA